MLKDDELACERHMLILVIVTRPAGMVCARGVCWLDSALEPLRLEGCGYTRAVSDIPVAVEVHDICKRRPQPQMNPKHFLLYCIFSAR